jgi:hypothetical protein
MGTLTQAQIRKEKAEATDPEARKLRLLRIAFWLVAGFTGFLQIWLHDRIIWADTLSYLDSGDLLWRGDFANAITNHWSPALPFLLGLALKILHPVGIWEVAVVKLVDLLIFFFAIGSFDFAVHQFCRYHERSLGSEFHGAKPAISKLAITSVGYLLFIWTITRLLLAWYTTPDVLVMGVVFLIIGLLLKIKMGSNGLSTFAILGVVLGFSYLIKAPMFPLAFVFLGMAFLLVGDFKKAIPRVLLAFGLFAIIASPLVYELSKLAGGLTFGKSGAWNYARTVNGIGVAYHWRGQPAGTGTPLHPTRVIFQNPTVYEFGSPVKGTFPPWRDPYYWFAGITPHFELRGQWRVFKADLKIFEEEASELEPGFIYGFLILLCMSSDRRLIGRIVAKQWFLLLPCVAALAMYSVVLVEDRYIAPFPVVIGLVLFSGLAVVRSANSLKLVNMTVLLAAALFAASSAKPAAAELLTFARSLHHHEILGREEPWHLSMEAVSDALKTRGLQRGDQVAYIGEIHDFYWARLAGLQVNAEILQQDSTNYNINKLIPRTSIPGMEPNVDIYWASPPELKEEIDRALYKVGSKAIVTDAFPDGGEMNGWDHVPGTPYYIHMLSASGEGDSK